VIHEPHRKDLIHLQYYGPKDGIHETAWLVEPNISATNSDGELRKREPQKMTDAIDTLHDGAVVELTRGQSNDAAWFFIKMGQRTSTQMKELAAFILQEDREKVVMGTESTIGDLLGVKTKYLDTSTSTTVSSNGGDMTIEAGDDDQDCHDGNYDDGVDRIAYSVDSRGYPYTVYNPQNDEGWDKRRLQLECIRLNEPINDISIDTGKSVPVALLN